MASSLQEQLESQVCSLFLRTPDAEAHAMDPGPCDFLKLIGNLTAAAMAPEDTSVVQRWLRLVLCTM